MNKKRIIIDMIVVALLTTASFFLAGAMDILEKIVEFSNRYEAFEIDEIVSSIIVLSFCLVVFCVRRLNDLSAAKTEVEKTNKALSNALAEVKELRGILPICSFCKKIRDDKGYWQGIEGYIASHSLADFTHSVCPTCLEEHYSDIDEVD
jgi:hypothetical protein